MEKKKELICLLIISVLYLSCSLAWSFPIIGFSHCLTFHSQSNLTKFLYTQNTPQYDNILQSTSQNLRFNSSTSSCNNKPRYILTPENAQQVRAALICSRLHLLQVRVRSGGHDYEGLSYRANSTFALIDLVNLRKVDIDLKHKTAWVEAGATLGELYYQIANKSQTLGFPAGLCPSIGVGGHISGGGQGTLMRGHGLAADNVIDAVLVNAHGEILNRSSMGEDLFWAIRGGGGASFGIIVAYKIKLVPIPPTVTAFTVPVTLQQNETSLIHKWQQIAPKLPKNLFIRIILTVAAQPDGTKTIRALFNSLYVGPMDQLLVLMRKEFPQLGLERHFCKEMKWIESVLYFDRGYQEKPDVSVLMNPKAYVKGRFVAKSDFVNVPIPVKGLEEIWKAMLENGEPGVMIWDPYGGKMGEIPSNATPFPHRAGILYNIQYFSRWNKEDAEVEKRHVDWINHLYDSMEPYVTKNPRAAYLNYRDLSIGRNKYEGAFANYKEAKVWGEKYFNNNFERLARVKKEVDPLNFFRNDQSIPPLGL